MPTWQYLRRGPESQRPCSNLAIPPDLLFLFFTNNVLFPSLQDIKQRHNHQHVLNGHDATVLRLEWSRRQAGVNLH